MAAQKTTSVRLSFFIVKTLKSLLANDGAQDQTLCPSSESAHWLPLMCHACQIYIAIKRRDTASFNSWQPSSQLRNSRAQGKLEWCKPMGCVCVCVWMTLGNSGPCWTDRAGWGERPGNEVASGNLHLSISFYLVIYLFMHGKSSVTNL